MAESGGCGVGCGLTFGPSFLASLACFSRARSALLFGAALNSILSSACRACSFSAAAAARSLPPAFPLRASRSAFCSCLWAWMKRWTFLDLFLFFIPNVLSSFGPFPWSCAISLRPGPVLDAFFFGMGAVGGLGGVRWLTRASRLRPALAPARGLRGKPGRRRGPAWSRLPPAARLAAARALSATARG
eukprot:SAG22_NODE_1165_length_5292_cov_9.601964_1_plen_188_part_00